MTTHDRHPCHRLMCPLNSSRPSPAFSVSQVADANGNRFGERSRVDCPWLASLYCGGPNGRRGMTEVEWSN
jgi:hypothetical protein